jgi:hypothetical protein
MTVWFQTKRDQERKSRAEKAQGQPKASPLSHSILQIMNKPKGFTPQAQTPTEDKTKPKR